MAYSPRDLKCLFPLHLSTVIFSTYRSYLDGDLHVGLYHNASQCTCQGVTRATCEACRRSWIWHDGTDMSWWRWRDSEPTEFSCGRLSSDAWVANDCTDEMKYICQRGTCTCVRIAFLINNGKEAGTWGQ